MGMTGAEQGQEDNLGAQFIINIIPLLEDILEEWGFL
jgi:hypothetical protein